MLTALVEVGQAEGTGGVCMSKRKGKPTSTGRRTGWRQGPALEAGFLVRGQGVSGSVRSPGSLLVYTLPALSSCLSEHVIMVIITWNLDKLGLGTS